MTSWSDSVMASRCYALADPGGRRRRAPPQQDPFLSFLHTFSPKSVCIGGQRPPPTGGAPPTGNPGSATAMLHTSVAFPMQSFNI